jgi:glyoxylase-like metal-dependent hydrolase (beta-lactamase superfamily II)
MKLYPLICEKWKMDGGACFGVVPKSIWQKLYPADENNMIDIISRSLLIETENRKILIDTGMGNKQDEKYFSYFFLHGDHSIEKSLATIGFTPDDITDVIFTHLHFDHCGGAVKYNQDKTDLELVFKNAIHWCSAAQWKWATEPNKREKASYFKENFMPLFDKGKLQFIEKEMELYKNIFLKIVNGHTDGQLIPMISYNNKIIVFMADFISAIGNIPIPYVPSFDTRPLISMKEKEEFLNEAVINNYILFFEHDYEFECCTLQKIEKRISHNNIMLLKDII